MGKNLYLHSGSYEVERGQLETVNTPAPTESWNPIPHLRLLELVQGALDTAGFEVQSEHHALAKQGDQYFGLLRVAKKDNAVGARVDYSWVAGVRNSHDKVFPAGLLFGSEVFVCDNLAFSGEIRISRKHTVHIMRDLPFLTTRAVGMLMSKWTMQDQRFDRYKELEVSNVDVHDIIIRALDNGVIGPTFIPRVLEEYRNPRYPEFAENNNIWRLFNSFTEVFKGQSLFVLPKRTEALTGLLDTYVGLVTPQGVVQVQDGVIEVN
jgi:hypothetical protein